MVSLVNETKTTEKKAHRYYIPRMNSFVSVMLLFIFTFAVLWLRGRGGAGSGCYIGLHCVHTLLSDYLILLFNIVLFFLVLVIGKYNLKGVKITIDVIDGCLFVAVTYHRLQLQLLQPSYLLCSSIEFSNLFTKQYQNSVFEIHFQIISRRCMKWVFSFCAIATNFLPMEMCRKPRNKHQTIKIQPIFMKSQGSYTKFGHCSSHQYWNATNFELQFNATYKTYEYSHCVLVGLKAKKKNVDTHSHRDGERKKISSRMLHVKHINMWNVCGRGGDRGERATGSILYTYSINGGENCCG